MALGYDRRLFLLPVEGSEADVVLDAAEHARAAAGLPAGEVAVLAAHDLDPAGLRDVTARGFTLALAVDDDAQERFALAGGDEFARPLEEHGPALCAARVRWHPDDAPEAKKAQALELTKLVAWLHETDRSLLLELASPPSGADLAAVDGDRGRDARERRPARTREAITELRELGVDADVWVVDAIVDRADAAALAELVTDAGRERVGVLVRTSAEEGLADALRTSAALAAYRGVAFDPAQWSDELEACGAGERRREEVVRTIGDSLAATIDLYTAAQPA